MKGWAEKLAQGWIPCPPPKGYMTIIENGKHIHVPNPDTKLLIQRAFKLYLDPNQSIETVTSEMDLMGIRTKKGRPCTKSMVHKMLQNPFYIGVNRFNGKDYPGAQETIIDKELFDKVQQKMHSKKSVTSVKHCHSLQNIIRCTDCNSLVTWQLQKGRYYGVCRRKSLGCVGKKMLREDKIEKIIIDKICSLKQPYNDTIKHIMSSMNHERHLDTETNVQVIKSIDNQISRLSNMENQLYDDKLAGDISAETYTTKHNQFTDRINQFNARLKELRSIQYTPTTINTPQDSINPLLSLYLNCIPNQKSMIMTDLFEDLIVSRGELIANLKTI